MNLVLMGQSEGFTANLEVGKDGQETQAHKDGTQGWTSRVQDIVP